MTLNKLTADALVDGTLDADAIGPASITTAKLHSNIISGQTAIGAVDASNDLLLIYDNDATSLKKVPVSSVGATNTDSITEGSSNLYYTNARADARAQLKIDALVDSAPGTLDTLNELAAALGDDANFSTTVTNSIATKLPLAGGTMTGSLILNSSSDLTVGNVGYWGGTSYGKLTWSATNNRAIVRGESGKNLSLGANGTQDYVFIKTDGNVGIGTDNPSEKLHVLGDVLISSGTSGDARLTIESDTDNNDENDNPEILFKQDGGWETGGMRMANNQTVIWNSIQDAFNGGIEFKTGTVSGYANVTTKMTIEQAGNVGIGTDDPEKKLHVRGGTVSGKHLDNQADILVEGADTRLQVMASDSGNNGSAMILSTVDHHWVHHAHATTSNNMYSLGYYNSSSTAFDSAGLSSEILNITTAGNVGIGNTSPNDQLAGAANLVIGTTSDADSGMTFVSTTTGQSLIHFSDANSGNARYDGFIGYEQNNRAMKFGTAQAERMRITSGGILQGLSDAEIITSPIRKHSNTISTNTTIATTENAIAGGPINVATGVTLTINGNFTVV